MSMRASWCLLALLGLFVLAAAAVRAQDDADTVMVEVQDFYDSEDSTNMMETESESSSSWAGLSTPPLELASLESSQQSAADFEPQPANDMSPKGDVEEVGTYTASVPEDAEDHALLEANTAVDAAVVAEAQAQLPTPDIDFNKRVEYTVSYELYIPHLRGNWANIFSRGASDGDRTPAMWTYPSGSRIHFRHASTRSWNDGVDSATSGPVGRWFEVKGVVKHNRAWIFVDGNFDNYVDLGPHHHFVWGQKSSLIRTKGQVNPYYDNSMQLRNWQWKNYAEDLPASIPQPNLYGPVRYTVEFDVFVDAPYHGWRNVFLRGAHNGDRTPGVWTWPSSTRLHWRHATTHDWNFDLDPSWAPPFGQWYSFKGVIDHNRAWCYINGMLDRVVDLSHTGQHFTWGSKSLGFLKGPAVHPSYAPTQMRNFKWSNEAEPFPGIKPNFHKTPEFTFSVDIKIPHTRPMHHWPALFVCGNNWGDRSPGLWYMSHNKAIHIRFGSTYTWNTDLDTTTPSPIGRWFNLKVVMDKTKAWVYLDGRLDRFVELPQGHVFRWNGRTLSFARGASIHPGHHNSGNTRIKMRNLKWSNTAEPLPLALPKPNFNGAVDYTMEVDVYVPHLVPNWGCIMNRGRDNGDRTPGIWTWPSSSRIHVRHTSTASSNWDCDSSSAAPVGQWFTLKTIFNHNKCQTYINGRLDRESTLPAGHHFTWGSKSLGWAHGGAVHPSYYDVQTQNLRFTPNTTTEAFVSPLENPNAAFWGAVLRPADQTPPPKAQLFLPPKGVKAPKMAVKKLAPIPPPKRVNPADAKVLAPGEAPKAPKPKKMQPLPKVKKIAPPTKPVIINPMSGKSVSGKAVPPAVVKAPKPAPLITKANLAQMRPELAAAAKKAADALAAKKRAAKAAQDAKDAEARRKRDSTRDSARDAADAARSAEADRLAREAARRAAEKDALAAKLEARRQKLLAEDRAEDSHREARRARKAREHAEEMKLLADIDGKKTPVLPPSGFLGGGAGAKGPKAGANANGGGASLEDNLNGLGMGIQDDGVGESKFVNGFWVGKYAPKHTNAERKLCPDCAPIIYNADSPLSDDDIKLLHKQHADLVLGGVKLHSQDTLDRATLMLDDADALKKKLLDKYPSKNDQ